MNEIDNMIPRTGRVLKENGNYINEADILSEVYDSENKVLKTSASVNIPDIEIGAVGIKNKDSDDRLVVDPNGKITVKQADGDNVTIGSKSDAIELDPAKEGGFTVLSGIKGLLSYLKNIIASNRVQVDISALPVGANFIGRSGAKHFDISVEITRPANTTQYGIGALINAATNSTELPVLDFTADGGVANQRIQIHSVSITSSNGAIVTPKLLSWVSFYTSPTITGQNLGDNQAFNPTYAEIIAKGVEPFVMTSLRLRV